MTVDVTQPRSDSAPTTWVAVCRLDDLAPERGAAAIVAGVQVALFRTVDDTVYAVQQLDPYSGAHVMSRGIVGTRGEASTVASPMFKQVFDLRSGECLDSVGRDLRTLDTWATEVRGGVVHVARPDAVMAP
ncbi:nitrite reductase small subunit NirD [Knoellia sp. CPCC 206450]|uniref:nitrite reductase small subunit NirD n=1 Tax=Knoellia tibetensis TaxID=3404798 RepID=UPI003B43C5DE